MTQKLYKKGIVDLFHDSFFYITWEQRKLSDCMDLDCGQDYKHLSKGNIPVYGTGGYMLSVDRALSYDKDGIGIGRKGTIDKPYLLKAPFWTVDTLFFAIPKKKNDLFFLLCLFSKIDWKSKDESTGVPSLSKQTINKVDVIIPQNHEQEVIGTFFQKIDNLITLHQRKHFIVKCVFCNGKKDRIWANAWEQREFGYYFDERNERSGEGELISVTVSFGIKKYNELGRYDTKPDDMSNYKRVVAGDIAYNSMRMWQGASGYSPYTGILSPAYTVITPKYGVSAIFFSYLLKRPYMIHLFEINSQGLTSDTWNLKYPVFSKIKTSAPINSGEQVQISEIFVAIDNLITLHQCKVEKLKNIKSALLEKMFV